MKKFGIYARKSTESEDRQVLSIQSQMDEMEKTAQSLELNVVKRYREAQSASKLGRPRFAEMMQDVMDGKIDGILCWKLDRLARNPIDGGQVIWALKEQNLVIQTPAQLYSADKENQIMLYLEFGMAQKFTDDLSKNVKRGNWKKINMGGWCGVAPIGYLNKLDDHTLIPDKEKFPLIRKLWDMVLEGMPPEQARDVLNNKLGFRTVVRKRSGGKPLSRSGLYRLLRNPFYHGVIERKHDGKSVRFMGAHQPMITDKEYWEVQKILGRPVPKPQKAPFAFSGLIYCEECGGMFSPYEKIKKSSKRYVYYRCSRKSQTVDCSQKQMTEKQIEDQIQNILSTITIPSSFADWAVKWLRYLNDQESGTQSIARDALQGAYNDAQRRLDRLTDLLLQELIDEETYKEKKFEIMMERDGLKVRLDDKEQEADNWITKVEQVFEFAKSAEKNFRDAQNIQARQDIVHGLGANYTLLDGKLNLSLEPVWELFAAHTKQLQIDIRMCDLVKNGEVNEKTDAFTTVFPRWQGWQESNLRQGFWRPL